MDPAVDLTQDLQPGHTYGFAFSHPGLMTVYVQDHPGFPQAVADYVMQNTGADVTVTSHGAVFPSDHPDGYYVVGIRVNSMAAYGDVGAGTATTAQVGLAFLSVAVIVSALAFAFTWPSIKDFLVQVLDTGTNPSSPISKIADATRTMAWAAAGFALAFVLSIALNRRPGL